MMCSIKDFTSNRRATIQQIVQDGPMITAERRAILCATYIPAEVTHALFSIPGNKALGPYGFRSHFYRDAWNIIKDDVINVIIDVLNNRKMLKELNNTVITLIPKTKCPTNLTEFRPISYCNTLYKCVTKVLGARIRQVLPDLIMENQGGFVHGRYIAHNIMFIKDMVKQYGRKHVQPSCLMKIHLQKAYDTVN